MTSLIVKSYKGIVTGILFMNYQFMEKIQLMAQSYHHRIQNGITKKDIF